MFSNLFGGRFNQAPATVNLVIINVLFFLASLMLKHTNFDVTMSMWYLKSHMFKFWQPLTHMFMHASFGHIFFNMFGLLMFGNLLERVWGTPRFLLFYFTCGFGAALIQQFAYAYEIFQLTGQWFPHYEMGMVLGASGAIVGIFVAFAMLFPNTEMYMMFIPIPIKAKYAVLIMVAIDLFGGLGYHIPGQGNVANFAHLGGALFAFIMILIWKRQRNSLY